MHLIDTLRPGGAERVAVNLANLTAARGYQVHLGTTRFEGDLATLLAADVARLKLARTARWDWRSVGRLAGYLRRHQIRIVHAHGTAVFIAQAAAMLCPRTAVIWHNHYGQYAQQDHVAWPYRLLARRIEGTIVVNEPLAQWSRQRLRVPAERVWHVPNFVLPMNRPANRPALPAAAGKRIVCVANVRPEKDHLTLLHAMQQVVRHDPDAHLLVVGATDDGEYCRGVRQTLQSLGLDQHVTLLGPRQDVAAILHSCDIAVLSSAIEGMPLALVEYGTAGLPTVATDVGQCAEVLEQGDAGIVVPPKTPAALADALLRLLGCEPLRRQLAARFQQRVARHYDAGVLLDRICEIYQSVSEERYLSDGRHHSPSGHRSLHTADASLKLSYPPSPHVRRK